MFFFVDACCVVAGNTLHEKDVDVSRPEPHDRVCDARSKPFSRFCLLVFLSEA